MNGKEDRAHSICHVIVRLSVQRNFYISKKKIQKANKKGFFLFQIYLFQVLNLRFNLNVEKTEKIEPKFIPKTVLIKSPSFVICFRTKVTYRMNGKNVYVLN